MFLYVFWAGAAASAECVTELSKNQRKASDSAATLSADNVGSLFDFGFAFIMVGVVCWIMDNFFCIVLRALPVYPQLHAWGWHLGTCLGLWCMYQLLLVHFSLFQSNRISAKGAQTVAIRLEWLLGCVPVVQVKVGALKRD
jgi:hypothetical protein